MKFNNQLTVFPRISHITDDSGYDTLRVDSTTHDFLPIEEYLHKANPSFRNSKTTGIMPPGVLHFTDSYVIYERPPQYQNVQVIFDLLDQINYDKHEPILYRIALPWQLYIATYATIEGTIYPNSVRMFFMNTSLHSYDFLNTHLYLPPLPNFYANGLLCRPMYSDSADVERYTNDISGVIQATYDWIWNSGTNLDLTMAPLEMFLQSQNNKDLRCIVKSSLLAGTFTSTQYYCSQAHVQYMFERWQNISSLHDILDYDWPNPSAASKPLYYLSSNHDTLLQNYLEENSYDDDYHHCHPDGDYCECTPSYDEHEYYCYARATISQPKTFAEIMNSVIREELSEISKASSSTHELSKYIYQVATSLAN